MLIKTKEEFKVPDLPWISDQLPHEWRKSSSHESDGCFFYYIEGPASIRNSGFWLIPVVVIAALVLPVYAGLPFWVGELGGFLAFLGMIIREFTFKPKPGKKMAPVLVFELTPSSATFHSPLPLDIESREDFNKLVIPIEEINSVGETSKTRHGDKLSWLKIRFEDEYFELGPYRPDQVQLMINRINKNASSR